MPCAGARLNSSRPKVVTLFYEVAPTTFPATRSLLSGVNARIYRALNWFTQGCRLSATTFYRILTSPTTTQRQMESPMADNMAFPPSKHGKTNSQLRPAVVTKQSSSIDTLMLLNAQMHTTRSESSTANSSRDSSPSIAIRSGRPSALHPAPTDGLNPNADRHATAAVSAPSTPAGPMHRHRRQEYHAADAAEPTSDCWQKPCA